jgi:hypothetical protein
MLMPSNSQFNLTILWEDELRLASALLKAAHEEQNDDERAHKMGKAYQACQVALWNLGDADALVVIGSADIKRRVESREPQPGDPC